MKAIHIKIRTTGSSSAQRSEKPTAKDHEVLIKVHAASVNAYDWHLLTAGIFLVRLLAVDCSNLKTRGSALTSPGGLKRLAKPCSKFGPGMKCSRISPDWVVAVWGLCLCS